MGGCSAPNCSNQDQKFRMFRFPTNPERSKKWLINCRRDKWKPTSNSRLCEVHFEESQFESGRADGWKKLKPNAIPTLFNIPNISALITSESMQLKQSIEEMASVVPSWNVNIETNTPKPMTISNETLCPSPLTAGKDQGLYIVPDVPEDIVEEHSSSNEGFSEIEKNDHFRDGQKSFLQVIPNDSSSVKSESNEQSSSCSIQLNETKQQIDSGMESNTNQLNKQLEEVNSDVLEERERCLKFLMGEFPLADILEMQDILMFAEWDVKQAISFVKQYPIFAKACKNHTDNPPENSKKLKCENSLSKSLPKNATDEIENVGWLSRLNKVTMRTYSKNTIKTNIYCALQN